MTALERADPESGDDPAWIAHFDEAYLADELAHCHRDLGQAEAAARRARGVAGRASREPQARRRAIGYVLLATAQVQQREIEQACHTGLKAVELLGSCAPTGAPSTWTTSSSGWSPTGTSRW